LSLPVSTKPTIWVMNMPPMAEHMPPMPNIDATAFLGAMSIARLQMLAVQAWWAAIAMAM
jgi:hypothetical protein